MGRPVKYTDEIIKQIAEAMNEYTSRTEIPIAAEFAWQNNVPKSTLYKLAEDNDELLESIRRLTEKSGRNNKKKYDYETGDCAITARYKQDPVFKLKVCMTARIRDAMVRNSMAGTTASKLRCDLGYTIDELKRHLEKLFVDDMSWENYGEWHIDHIKPVKMFKYKTTEDEGFKECWALENLQPLWAADNIRKGCYYVRR